MAGSGPPNAGESDRWRALLGLALLCAPIFFFRLGGYGAVGNDEGFYHAVAESMLDSGNWLRIDFRGEHRPYDTFMNAPLQYWLRAVLIGWFGNNYWTMRIASAVFGAGCVLLTWWIVAERAGERPAWLAALIQLTTFQFVYLHSARTGVLESGITFFFVLTAHLFARGITGRHGFIGHHLCIAVLVNLKLPFAIVPILAELAYFATDREARRQIPRWLLTGAAIAPLALSWHLFQALAVGEPFGSVLGRMSEQGAGATDFVERRFENLGYYLLTVVYGTFPFALLLPWALGSKLRGVDAPPLDDPQRNDWKLFAWFAGCVFVFFVIVSKRSPWYVIPAYPFLSAFAGVWLAERIRRGGVAVFGFAVAIGLLVWVDVGFGRNPFDSFGMEPYRRAGWLDVWPLPAWIGLPLTVGLLAAVGSGIRRAFGARSESMLAMALCGLLIGYAGVRVALPLRFTGYTGETEQIRRALDAASLTGAAIRYPVVVERGSPIGFAARYYFAHDHRIVRFPSEPGVKVDGYQLFPIDAKNEDLTRPDEP